MSTEIYSAIESIKSSIESMNSKDRMTILRSMIRIEIEIMGLRKSEELTMKDIHSFQNSMDELQDRLIEVERRTKGDDIVGATSQVMRRIDDIETNIIELQHTSTSVEHDIEDAMAKSFDNCEMIYDLEQYVEEVHDKVIDELDDITMKFKDDLYECDKQIAKVSDDLKDFIDSSDEYNRNVKNMINEASTHLLEFSTQTCTKMEEAADSINDIYGRIDVAKCDRHNLWRSVNDITELVDDLTLKVSKNTLEITSDDILNVRKLVEFVDDRDFRKTTQLDKNYNQLKKRFEEESMRHANQINYMNRHIEALEKRIKDLEPKDDWTCIQ